MVKYDKAANIFYQDISSVYFLNNMFFVIRLFGLCVTKIDPSSVEHN